MDLRQRKVCPDRLEEVQEEDSFKALYVIIFSSSAHPDTVAYVLDLITRSQLEGGAELLTRTTHAGKEGIILEIGATIFRLLEAAEALEITKEDKNGNIKEFVFSNLEFFLKPGLDMNNLLSTAEKQRIILEELLGIRSMEKRALTGYPNIQLYPGQSIVQVCKNNHIIDCIYPLHEPSELETLKKNWSFTKVPIGDVRNYFGEAVAFYFTFICFYTWALLPPAFVGMLQTVISFDISRSHVPFAIFKMIWLTLFLEYWKRKSNELAYTWCTLRLVTIPKLHPTFRGRYMEIDPVTKLYVPVYPAYRRHFKVYCISLPLVTMCLLFAVVIMFIYFQIEKYVINTYDDGSLFGYILTQVPGIVYAIIVYVMNVIYAYIANILTEWENHKTQDSFDNHRIVKLLLFEFVNNFIAMGYIAFYEQDLNMLKWQIAVMMVVNQLFNQFQEAILPYLLQKYQKKWKEEDTADLFPRIKEILEQRKMWTYEGTYDDYLEVFTQFGYVFLFSSVFPLAAALAVLNNIIEMWTDGLKLCYSYQRPQARPVKGIGVWQLAFEVLGLLAVMSNCALITMSPIIRSYAPEMSLSSWLLVAVVFEHVIIGIKMTLSYLISDVPKWVTVAIQRAQYESLQVLKMDRKIKTKEMLKSMKLKNPEKLE
ncbi:anoctamin-10-like [Uloborus diversus]|uniref:anoctamin-10-like n=1 Tax=Uloborus diversus TaxID=327109 RepID=UPI002409DA34|nr:anoctamin-10-like [Uloborus diversus]